MMPPINGWIGVRASPTGIPSESIGRFKKISTAGNPEIRGESAKNFGLNLSESKLALDQPDLVVKKVSE